MAKELSHTDLLDAREEVLDQLSEAKQREGQLAYAARTGDTKPLLEQQEAVRRLETELAGINYGLGQKSAEAQERKAAERAVSARNQAVDMTALIHQHFWAVQSVDKALVTASNFVEEVTDFANQIQRGTGHWGDDIQGEGSRRSLLAMLGIGDMADIPAMFDRDVRIRRYARGLPHNRVAALRILATVLPEVLDPEVQAEGLALAKERADNDETVPR